MKFTLNLTSEMSFSLQKQSFDTYVKTIIAENEVELKRKQLGELKEKLIDLNAEIDEIVS